ncbi:VOC family protein [Deinococcus koreensis]|nr:VOC family protein [Deinococcus koreensis]
MHLIEMTPVLPVSDLARSTAFYRDVLSFEVVAHSAQITLRRQ